MADGGDIGRGLLSDVTGKVDGIEERVCLEVVCPIPAQAAVSRTAQLRDEVSGLSAEPHLRGNVQCVLPVDYLWTVEPWLEPHQPRS